MNPTDADFAELRHLADAAIDGCLTEVQQARLEHLVLSHPELRRHYADYLGLNASLQWATGSPVLWTTPPTPAAPRPRPWLARHWGSVALCLICGLLLQVVWLTTRTTAPLAVLTDTKACKWDGGTLPTEAGTKLNAGRLRLAEGIAHIVFASGTEVKLEGPADIELVTPMRCVLHRGKLIAKVPPQATGFVVDTPTSVVTDYGTEFGVTVHDGMTATGSRQSENNNARSEVLAPETSSLLHITKPPRTYSSRYIQLMATKCGSCQKKSKAKSHHASGRCSHSQRKPIAVWSGPAAAAQPMTGGNAPETAPTRVLVAERCLSGV